MVSRRLIGGNTVCHCEAYPVLMFRSAGRWTEVNELRRALVGELLTDAEASSLSIAEVYRVTDSAAWLVACPLCRAVYIGASTPPLSPVDDVVELVTDCDDLDAPPWSVDVEDPGRFF